MKANFETGLKICSKCGIEQPISNFNKNKSTPDGLQLTCKGCRKQYRQDKSEGIKEYSKQYRLNNSKEIKQYRQDHVKESNQYYQDHVKEIKQYKQDNVEEIKEYQKQYRQNHKKESKQYYQNHRKERNIRNLNRLKLDSLFKLACNLRSRLNTVLRQKYLPKKSKLSQYLGCSLKELKLHLKKQFTEGMTWENHGKGKGKWNIDHIVPLDSCEIYNLDGTRNDELSTNRLFELCHYTNLQPLWADDNLKKSNKII